jgi:hypothetical protein
MVEKTGIQAEAISAEVGKGGGDQADGEDHDKKA